jgi:hypothetical protein
MIECALLPSWRCHYGGVFYGEPFGVCVASPLLLMLRVYGNFDKDYEYFSSSSSFVHSAVGIIDAF